MLGAAHKGRQSGKGSTKSEIHSAKYAFLSNCNTLAGLPEYREGDYDKQFRKSLH